MKRDIDTSVCYVTLTIVFQTLWLHTHLNFIWLALNNYYYNQIYVIENKNSTLKMHEQENWLKKWQNLHGICYFYRFDFKLNSEQNFIFLAPQFFLKYCICAQLGIKKISGWNNYIKYYFITACVHLTIEKFEHVSFQRRKYKQILNKISDYFQLVID